MKWIAVDGKFASFDIYMLICNSFWLLLTRCILHSTAKRVKFDNLQFAKSTTFLRSMPYKCVTLMDHFMGVEAHWLSIIAPSIINIKVSSSRAQCEVQWSYSHVSSMQSWTMPRRNKIIQGSQWVKKEQNSFLLEFHK